MSRIKLDTKKFKAQQGSGTSVFNERNSTKFYNSDDGYKPVTRAELQLLRASDALKVRPSGLSWHLAAPKRAAPLGSGAGGHTAPPSFGITQALK
eukprot:5232229-Pleurochrysis_carterae.AAC.1